MVVVERICEHFSECNCARDLRCVLEGQALLGSCSLVIYQFEIPKIDAGSLPTGILRYGTRWMRNNQWEHF